MFRTVFPSIIRSSRLYIQQQAYVKQTLLLLASLLATSGRFFPSIIRSSQLYIQQQTYVKQIVLLLSSTQTAVSV